MKNARIPNKAIPPATDNPMIDPVPSPDPPPLSGSFGGVVEVGEASAFEFEFEAETVTTTTVGEPFDPVLSMLLSCAGCGVGVFCGVDMVEGVFSCVALGGVSEVVEVGVGSAFECDEGAGCCCVVVVPVEGVGGTLCDDCTTGEREFWRGMNWTP